MYAVYKSVERAMLVRVFLLSLLAALAACSEEHPNLLTEEFDFIVVGAGTAGSVVASRLAEQPEQRVLLLEAGGEPPLLSKIQGLSALIPSKYKWNYEADTAPTVCRAQRAKLPLPLGKMLGGSSGVGSMVHALGHARDYDSWAAAGGSASWGPLSMVKYLKKIESIDDSEIINAPYGSLRGRHGKIRVTKEVNRNHTLKYFKAFFEIGHKISYDYNMGSEPTFAEAQRTFGNGARSSAYKAYLVKRAARPNLRVLTHTLASRVLFDKNNNAVAVEAFSKDGALVTFKARNQIILSAGAINTPQILLQSGIGPKEHLKELNISAVAHLPVGENLQDHVVVPVLLKAEKDLEHRIHRSHNIDNIYEYPNLIMGFVAFNKTEHSQPDYQVMSSVMERGSNQPLILCTASGLRDRVCEQFHNAAKRHEVLYTLVTLLHPESRGRVRLRSTDPAQAPDIYMGYYDKRQDLERHTTYVEDFLRVVNTASLKSAGPAVVDAKLDECEGHAFGGRGYWRCYVQHMAGAGRHPAGSAALGAVLDARLCVRRVRRLRVVDASAVPALPSGNLNAPVAQLAERAVDLIEQDRCGVDTYEYVNIVNEKSRSSKPITHDLNVIR